MDRDVGHASAVTTTPQRPVLSQGRLTNATAAVVTPSLSTPGTPVDAVGATQLQASRAGVGHSKGGDSVAVTGVLDFSPPPQPLAPRVIRGVVRPALPPPPGPPQATTGSSVASTQRLEPQAHIPTAHSDARQALLQRLSAISSSTTVAANGIAIPASQQEDEKLADSRPVSPRGDLDDPDDADPHNTKFLSAIPLGYAGVSSSSQAAFYSPEVESKTSPQPLPSLGRAMDLFSAGGGEPLSFGLSIRSKGGIQ